MRTKQSLPAGPAAEGSAAELGRLEDECWQAIQHIKRSSRPSMTALVAAVDQLRRLQNDKLRLLSEQLRRAREEPPEGWEELRDKMIAALQEHPDALAAVMAAIDDAPGYSEKVH